MLRNYRKGMKSALFLFLFIIFEKAKSGACVDPADPPEGFTKLGLSQIQIKNKTDCTVIF